MHIHSSGEELWKLRDLRPLSLGSYFITVWPQASYSSPLSLPHQ